MSPVILPVQSSMSLRSNSCQLTVVQTAMPADLDLTPDMDTEGIRELEGVEESVGYDGGSLVYCFGFQESGNMNI